jgi:phage FluMu protein Com
MTQTLQIPQSRVTPLFDTKPIKCPMCKRGKLMEITKVIAPFNVKMYKPPEYDSAEILIKCPKCGKLIGISKK